MSIDERIRHIIDFDKKKNDANIVTIEKIDDLISITIKVNRNEYINKLSSYSEILKEYFDDYRIYVLSKTKDRRGLHKIYAILFQNSKESVMSEIKSFNPNYLARKEGVDILISQDENSLCAFELPPITDDHFSFRGYRYKIANEISLK